MEANNKLIAEFMGWKLGHPELLELRWGNEWFDSDGFKQTTKGYLHFDSSWEWLIPVIKKINEDFIELDCDIFDGGHAHEVYGIEDAVWENNVGGAVIHVVSLIKALSSLEK